MQEGDVILLGTDGLFDNMKDDMIVKHILRLQVRLRRASPAWCVFNTAYDNIDLWFIRINSVDFIQKKFKVKTL